MKILVSQGHMSGTGRKENNLNVITPEHLAKERDFIIGQDYGVMQGFSAEITDGVQAKNTIKVHPGVMQAFGYVGRKDEPVEFSVVTPKGTEFIYVYAEIDLSTIPNVFSIRTRNNGMREDDKWIRQVRLDEIRTGKFQLLLYKARLTAKGFVSLEKQFNSEIIINKQDGEIIKELVGYSYPLQKARQVKIVTGKVISGYISGNTTAETQAERKSNIFFATTQFAVREITRETRI